MSQNSYFNRGLYTAPEAGRILGKSPSWIYRLIRGYAFTGRTGVQSRSPQLFTPEVGEVDGVFTVTFLDLIELLFVRDFLKAGVSLFFIRKAAHVAADLFGEHEHPFCVKKFQTDGKRIFARAASDVGDDKMLDLVGRQHVFARVVEPYMKQLEYSATGNLLKWFPLGNKRHVVLHLNPAPARPPRHRVRHRPKPPAALTTWTTTSLFNQLGTELVHCV